MSDWTEELTKYSRLAYEKKASNGWCEGDHEQMPMRTKNYLNDQKKEPSLPPFFTPLGFNVYRSEKQVVHAAKNIASLRKFIETNSSQYHNQFFVVNWQLPGTPKHSAVFLFGRTIAKDLSDPAEALLEKYLASDSAFRNSRFKFIARMIEAPTLVRAGCNQLGGQKPSILGNNLTCLHFTGRNYFEVDIDVGSSKIAGMLQSLILKNAKALSIDQAFLLEGHSSEELPERLLGVVRCMHCDCAGEYPIPITLAEDYDPSVEALLSTYLSPLELTSTTATTTTATTAGTDDVDKLSAALQTTTLSDDDDDDDDDFQDFED